MTKIPVDRELIQDICRKLWTGESKDVESARRVLVDILDSQQNPNKSEFVATPSGMWIVGQQKRVTMEDGEFIVEWNGSDWFKKYLICQVTKYNATGCWQEEVKTPVDTEAHSLEKAHQNAAEKLADFNKWLDKHPEAEKQTPINLITPEELMEIVKEGQKIYGDKETFDKGILFSFTKTVQEVIEELERLSNGAKRISERPEGTDQKYYCGISDGIKWSIRRVKNIEQAVETEVSGDNVTPTFKNMPIPVTLTDRQAIIEILDMLTKIHYIIDYKEMREQASKLKTKLGGLS